MNVYPVLRIFLERAQISKIFHILLWKLLFLKEDSFYASFDLSQAENRIVAYVSNCITMIKAFERGEDIHSLTAKMIMEVFYNGHIPENVVAETKSPLGDGKLTWRD